MWVKKENEEKVFNNLYGDFIYEKLEKLKFEVGDKVRILKYKRKVFDKGWEINWIEELFVIDEVLLIKFVIYKFVDLMGEEKKGKFL